MEKKKFPCSIALCTKAGFCIFAIMVSVILMVGQAIGAENSILYLHSKRGAEWSGTLDYTPPTRSIGEPVKAELPEYSNVYLFAIQADFDTAIPAGLYIFDLWIKADNDQRVTVCLGCKLQDGGTINFGGDEYEVTKNAGTTEYSFEYHAMSEPYKIYKGEWFYAYIWLRTGLTLYIDHQSTPSSIITPTPIAIPEFPYRIQLVLLIGIMTCISLAKWKSIHQLSPRKVVSCCILKP